MSDSDGDFDGPMRVGGHRSEIQAASQSTARAEPAAQREAPRREVDAGAADRVRAELQRSEQKILTALEESGKARHDEMAYLYNEITSLKKDLGGTKRVANFAYFLLIFFAVALFYIAQNPMVIGRFVQWVTSLIS